ncbi:TerB family tellurite resistance protein [Streptomyces sp. NPDC006879]|uniref:TerB family tellurite resistance protein n=1 Tax=Streptomyces sp. NPDC006879 TaxID=3364767 RepID=UPI0036738E75
MLPARGRTGRRIRFCGIRITWSTDSDGEFFCPACGGDRNYRRRTGRRRFALLGVPLLPRGLAGPVVECGACHERYAPEVLDQPTTTRFASMLRDAVHTIALAVLTAGGTGSRTAVSAATSAVRAAGFEDATSEQLTALAEGLAAGTERFPEDLRSVALSIELHEALEPLTGHLAPVGRESLLLQGARIALADGPYLPAEHEALATIGNALHLGTEEVARLLAAARTPS